MTQGQIAEAIYGDKNHSPNIYASLSKLVVDGIVARSGRNPSYYSLSDVKIEVLEKSDKLVKSGCDIAKEIITNESLDEVEKDVMGTDNYGPEMDMITRCLKKYPYNTDADLVAMQNTEYRITGWTSLFF